MRITNQTPVNSPETTPVSSRSDSPTSGAASPASAASSSSPAVSALDYSLVPSFELLSLNSLLAEVPPIRQDALAAAIRRMASGDLRTLAALEQTAQAMLG
jgi:hypothetical protein